jgi:capsule polysaccharide export protein KpsE/RkpR
MEGASTLTPPIYSREANSNVEITKDALQALQGELGTIQATLHEVELEHNELNEQLCMMQIRIKVLKHEVT